VCRWWRQYSPILKVYNDPGSLLLSKMASPGQGDGWWLAECVVNVRNRRDEKKYVDLLVGWHLMSPAWPDHRGTLSLSLCLLQGHLHHDGPPSGPRRQCDIRRTKVVRTATRPFDHGPTSNCPFAVNRRRRVGHPDSCINASTYTHAYTYADTYTNSLLYCPGLALLPPCDRPGRRLLREHRRCLQPGCRRVSTDEPGHRLCSFGRDLLRGRWERR
jgi:hypothetical protein